MNTNISGLKADTREFLIGKYNCFFGILVLYFLFTIAAGLVPMLFFTGIDLLNMVMKLTSAFILSLLLSMASVGFIKASFNCVDGADFTAGDLFFAFKYSADQFMIISLLLTVIRLLCTSPLFILICCADSEEMSLPVYSALYIICAALSILLTMALSLGFIWAEYFLIEDLTLSAKAALKKSLAFSKGRLFEMFKMKISFIGMYILSVCSFFIGFLYVKPYMEVTFVKYYLQNKD